MPLGPEEVFERADDLDTRYPPHNQEQFESDYYRIRADHQRNFELLFFSGDV